MPIYEYRCEPCDYTFETLVRTERDVAQCPKCSGTHLQKQFSVPATAQTGSNRGAFLPVCSTPGPGSMGCGAGGCGSGMCAMD
jgi:putative FmdB family regulatory protein